MSAPARPPDVVQRLALLRDTVPAPRLYALVDGVQYQTQQDKPLRMAHGLFPLFTGTPDAALAHAGPWLVDAEQFGDAFVAELLALEQAAPAVVWLIAV